MGRLKSDIYIPYPVSGVICGKVPIQEAPNGLPCAVSDARASNARVYESGRLRSVPLLHLFTFNSTFIFNSIPGNSIPFYPILLYYI